MTEIRQTAIFAAWMAGLRDLRARAKIAARIDRLALGNAGDVEPVGEAVSELRIHYGRDRVYFTRQSRTVIVLLCGGDKSTQAKDIEAAKSLAADLEPGS